MDRIKCVDVVNMLLDEATEQFGVLVREDRSRRDKFNMNCEILDDIIERFDGISADVNIDDETMDITISIVCSEFEIGSSDDVFYQLLKNTKHFVVRAYDDADDRIEMEFVFDGIWVKNKV